MALLLLHRPSGLITLEPGNFKRYALDHGFDLSPAVIDGDDCVKPPHGTDWVAPVSPIDS